MFVNKNNYKSNEKHIKQVNHNGSNYYVQSSKTKYVGKPIVSNSFNKELSLTTGLFSLSTFLSIMLLPMAVYSPTLLLLLSVYFIFSVYILF